MSMFQQEGMCVVVAAPQFTTNLFGSVQVIANKTLMVMERNDSGDCVCLLPDGSNLIDVDHRDITRWLPFTKRDPLEETLNMLQTLLDRTKAAKK